MAVSTIDPNGLNIGQIGGRRNLVINGAMQVAQRGTSVSNSAGGYTTVDRFFQTGTLGGTFAWEKSSDAPTGFSSSFKSSAPTGFASLASSASARIGTAFEGQDLQQLLKGTSGATDLTLSFWVKATVTGTYIVELYDTDNTRNICQSYTISASNTWQNVVMTFAGDTSGALDNDNAASLVVHWWLAAGSDFTSGTLPTSWQTAVTANRAVGQVNSMASNGNAFYITGVQLEVGDVATPFEHRSFGEELSACQRFYQKVYYGFEGSFGTSGNGTPHETALVTSMRASASITKNEITKGGHVSGFNSSNVYDGGSGVFSYLRISLNFSGSNYGYYLADFYLDAEL